jgi:2-amino-4-hydroxy-6-hydroxymethyldihydropteridine diphosphokinase
LAELPRRGIEPIRVSSLCRTAPVPVSDQLWYVNAVAIVATGLSPAGVLAGLHAVEQRFARTRRVRNEARTLDLDILDYEGRISAPGSWPELPHPRLAGRAFVLYPLAELAPEWRHPVTGEGVAELVAGLPAGQAIERIPADP